MAWPDFRDGETLSFRQISVWTCSDRTSPPLRNRAAQVDPKRQVLIEILRQSKMDLHIQKVADRMSEKRNAGQRVAAFRHEGWTQPLNRVNPRAEAIY